MSYFSHGHPLEKWDFFLCNHELRSLLNLNLAIVGFLIVRQEFKLYDLSFCFVFFHDLFKTFSLFVFLFSPEMTWTGMRSLPFRTF